MAAEASIVKQYEDADFSKRVDIMHSSSDLIRNRLPDTVITEDSNSGFLFIKSVTEKRGSLAEVREGNRGYIQNC